MCMNSQASLWHTDFAVHIYKDWNKTYLHAMSSGYVIWIDLYEGSQVAFSKQWCISLPKGCFGLNKQCRP